MLNQTYYQDKIHLSVQFMEKNLGQPILVSDCAKAATMSEFHFSRIFLAVTGQSPGAYLQELRLRRALSILRDKPNYSISDLCFELGFNSHSAFSRAFKRRFGRPPHKAASIKIDLRTASIVQRHGELGLRLEAKVISLEDTWAVGYGETGISQRGYAKAAAKLIGLTLKDFARHHQNVASNRFVSLYPVDPRVVVEEKVSCWMGVLVDQVPLWAKDKAHFLPGGKFLTVDYLGPYQNLWLAWEEFCKILVQAKWPVLADEPAREVYLVDPRNASPNSCLSRLLLPLKTEQE